jgi:hypothetical protein
MRANRIPCDLWVVFVTLLRTEIRDHEGFVALNVLACKYQLHEDSPANHRKFIDFGASHLTETTLAFDT